MPKQTTARRTAAPRKPRTNVVLLRSAASPSHAEIARRAFELYLARGGTHGADLNDWLRAEHELAQHP
ncbi:MAG TPA: DUF2934 domain-containing protein [Polyangiaceae bacterium]|nr:DUF2934 domain-containing protein [Polyangiaceae bacterium]